MTRILFATPRLLHEFRDCDSRLQDILIDLAESHWPEPTLDCRITCIHRTTAEEAAAGSVSGIHMMGPPHRAVDVGGANLTQQQLDGTANAINAVWEYDPTRLNKLVCFVRPHGTGPHFHLQVCAGTVRR